MKNARKPCFLSVAEQLQVWMPTISWHTEVVPYRSIFGEPYFENCILCTVRVFLHKEQRQEKLVRFLELLFLGKLNVCEWTCFHRSCNQKDFSFKWWSIRNHRLNVKSKYSGKFFFTFRTCHITYKQYFPDI